MRVVYIIVLLVLSVQVYADYITRINEEGEIIGGPREFSTGLYGAGSRGTVSENGYIYLEKGFHDLYCFDSDLNLVSEIRIWPYIFDYCINNNTNEIIYYKFHDSDKRVIKCDMYLNEIDNYPISIKPECITVDEREEAIWLSVPYWWQHSGLYKYSRSGTRIFSLPDDEGYEQLTKVNYDGRFWATYSHAYDAKLRLHNRKGLLEQETDIDGVPLAWHDVCIDPSDNSCWFGGSNKLMKFDTLGNKIVDLTVGVDDMSLNESDGSLWVVYYDYDYPSGYYVRRYDRNGNEILEIEWEEFTYAVAADSSDDTAVIFSGTYWGTIEPTSLGKIKALFK